MKKKIKYLLLPILGIGFLTFFLIPGCTEQEDSTVAVGSDSPPFVSSQRLQTGQLITSDHTWWQVFSGSDQFNTLLSLDANHTDVDLDHIYLMKDDTVSLVVLQFNLTSTTDFSSIKVNVYFDSLDTDGDDSFLIFAHQIVSDTGDDLIEQATNELFTATCYVYSETGFLYRWDRIVENVIEDQYEDDFYSVPTTFNGASPDRPFWTCMNQGWNLITTNMAAGIGCMLQPELCLVVLASMCLVANFW